MGAILLPKAGVTSLGLTYVRDDGEWMQVRRNGRFAVEEDCAANPAHLQAAVRDAQEKMIAGLEKQGFRFAGPGFELEGPLEHVGFSDSAEADAGPDGRPDPRDLAAMARWERAERARAARKMGEDVGLVDFVLKAVFWKRTPTSYRVHLPESR